MMRTATSLPFVLLMFSGGCGDDGIGVGSDVGTDTSTPEDSGRDTSTLMDTGIAMDSGTDSGEADTGETDTGVPPRCGDAVADVSGIRGSQAVVIARDGTIYYERTTKGSALVGRLAPGGTPETLITFDGDAAAVWALTLSPDNETLYVGTPFANSINVVNLADLSSEPEQITDAGRPLGITVSDEGVLYWSDFQRAGVVYRLSDGVAVQVTTSTIPNPSGVAFGDDGFLYVASFLEGYVTRLTLNAAGDEVSREEFVTGLGSPAGLAFDMDGSLYVTDDLGGDVWRVDPDGVRERLATDRIVRAGGLEFGAGPLSCTQLYVTSRGMMRSLDVGVEGRALPWH